MSDASVPYDSDNIFAKILRGEIPSTRVYEDDATLVFMDIMPRADGHCMVIPKTPCRNVLDATPDQLAAVMQTVQKVSRAVMRAFDATGVTIQQFNEADGGQEVFHLHVHILPRHAGDSLRPPGNMGDMDQIAEHARKIRAALE
ncbi:HIT family protein [Rhodobacteraceae bacterium F11138]|nr:HIT family protein [Rhodobacteraceae bacterium F11138]